MKNSFDSAFFAGNRQALLDSLGKGALVVLTAYNEMQRRNDEGFHFDQEGNFWYLTGISAPDWRVIIDGVQKKTWLVRPESNEIRELFDGSVGDKQALEISGANEVIDQTEAKQLLAKLRTGHSVACTIVPDEHFERFGFILNPAQKQLANELKLHFSVQDVTHGVGKLRAIKQPQEIAVIQRSIDTTIEGMKLALKSLKKMQYEYEFEVVTTGYFRSKGARDAYYPMVASGANACTLHYMDNNDRLSKKNWLLFDIGASYKPYAADITRTVPIGKATKWQTDVYEAALRVHGLAISLCRPGMNVKEYLKTVDNAMQEELVKLDIIKPAGGNEAMRKYFPHMISHGLGIDLHDPLGKPEQFKEGMVLTVEPGIYVPEKGFGVRIEDDILITASGPKNLSRALPTSLDELNKLML
jgi:Xaa-Pro aminopeptidase